MDRRPARRFRAILKRSRGVVARRWPGARACDARRRGRRGGDARRPRRLTVARRPATWPCSSWSPPLVLVAARLRRWRCALWPLGAPLRRRCRSRGWSRNGTAASTTSWSPPSTTPPDPSISRRWPTRLGRRGGPRGLGARRSTPSSTAASLAPQPAGAALRPAAALLLALALLLRPAATRRAWPSAYLFPSRLTVEVTPGTRACAPASRFTVRARRPRRSTAMVARADRRRRKRMPRRSDDRRTTASYVRRTFDDVTASFAYHVVAGARALRRRYAVTVVHPPRVERIDLRLPTIPQALGCRRASRTTAATSTALRAPRVRLHDHHRQADRAGALALADGTRVALQADGRTLDRRAHRSTPTASYRVALTDDDGLENARRHRVLHPHAATIGRPTCGSCGRPATSR